MFYTPKKFWTSQNFPESNASTPANVFGKKCLYVFFCISASICIGRETPFLPYAVSEMEFGHIL